MSRKIHTRTYIHTPHTVSKICFISNNTIFSTKHNEHADPEHADAEHAGIHTI